MSDFLIIRNAPPLPVDGRGRGSGRKGRKDRPRNTYPFGQLEVGDAFDVPMTEMWDGDGRSPDYNRLSAAVSIRNRYPRGPRFKVRMMPDGTTIRVRREA